MAEDRGRAVVLIVPAVGAGVVTLTALWRGGARPAACVVDRALLDDETIEELREAMERIVLSRDPNRLHLTRDDGA